MRKLLVAAQAILIVTALSTPFASAAPNRLRSAALDRSSVLENYTPEVVPGEVIVKFRKSMSRASQAGTVSALGGSVVAGPVGGLTVVKTAPGRTTEDLIEYLESDPSVAYAEPNLLRYTAMTPNDPMFVQQWGLNNTAQSHPISFSSATQTGSADADMNVPEAWDTQQGNDETVVAIMDSGVDVAHPDLAANIWVNAGEIAGNGIDDDGNGYKDDVNGWDFADNDATLLHPTGQLVGWDHGTHVAGIVGAVANNNVGGAGVCPSCQLMVLKIFEPFDTDNDGVKDTMIGDLAAELKAFDYAIRMDADIINGSFGGSIVSSRFERAKVKKAIAAGITTVLAAGNENGDNDLLIGALDLDGDDVPDLTSPAYPASYDLPGIIAVGASNDSDEFGVFSGCVTLFCSFSNWGRDSVDVSAPGVDILSTVPGGGYAAWDGTSMATPNVAGIAGLVKAEHPDYTPAQIANAIMNATDRPASLKNLFALPGQTFTGDFTVSGGRVDAAAALNAPTTDSFPTSDGTVAGAKSLTGTVSGNVSWPSDVNDVFKKKLARGAIYKAILNTSGDHDLDLQIYKPGVKEIWQLDEGCIGAGGACSIFFYEPTDSGDVTVRFRAPKDGTFYFHVNSWLLQTGNYSLKVVKL